MAELIDLLSGFPSGGDRKQSVEIAERLDRLEYAAQWHGAPETTMAAIKGTRILLVLAEIPPSPRIVAEPTKAR